MKNKERQAVKELICIADSGNIGFMAK